MINYSRLGYEIKRDLSKFSTQISNGLKRPQQKFVHQMVYGIIAGNKLHLSEIARSLKESITLKKTIERLSRNLHDFNTQIILWDNYLSLVKQHVKDDYAVIVPVYEKVFSATEIGFISETYENLCLLISAASVSVRWTEVLMQMIIIAIFSKTENALSSVQKRTAVSYITEIPVTSWM